MLVRLLSLFEMSCCYAFIKAATLSAIQLTQAVAINPANSWGRKPEQLPLLEMRVRQKQQVCTLCVLNVLGPF